VKQLRIPSKFEGKELRRENSSNEADVELAPCNGRSVSLPGRSKRADREAEGAGVSASRQETLDSSIHEVALEGRSG